MQEHNGNIREKHLWLIELLAWWQGHVNSSDLRDTFRFSRQQAQKYIDQYKTRYPANLYYDTHQKAFLPNGSFQQHLINGDVSEYLDWLNQQGSTDNLTTANHTNTPLTNASLSLPKRQVAPQIMRALVSAMQKQQRVEVSYVSMRTPDDIGRVIQPHTFVKTGLRWHLRAYDETHHAFRDFVLSRFRGEPMLSGPATHSQQDDPGWNTQVKLVFTPDPRLKPAQQQIIEQDYQMQNGKLVLSTRAALAQYLLQEMQVNTKFLAGTAEAQQLILDNLSDIKPWLFDN